ncbi:prenyltransferase [uncultured Senegalimassilia sp.]|uniref:prenyltransferase n=1 Tax=uncultured Senegalimassilia sp. TaxID=1714350 RepID=UPI0025F4F61C|nr:prenyltransferase [uncultured Senegalimassilia sp.]
MSHTQNQTEQPYGRFTAKMAIDIAAPHTWPASILPVAIAVCLAVATGYVVSASLTIVLLAICILMQSSVNTFNDYYDYVKGTDSSEDDVDPTDAVLVYNNVNPKSALAFAVALLVCAFVLGGYVIYRAGLIPLAIGVIGAVFVVIYSAGKTPISYLPLGEGVSGIVMGGLIPLACYQVLTGVLSPLAMLWALPEILGIGLIMFTNNTCDIEKDIDAQRRTLSVLLGRTKARTLYHAILALWILAMIAIVGVFFTSGLIVIPFMLLSAYPLLKAMRNNPLAPQSRQAAMAQICSVNIALGAWYAAAILASSSIVVW